MSKCVLSKSENWCKRVPSQSPICTLTLQCTPHALSGSSSRAGGSGKILLSLTLRGNGHLQGFGEKKREGQRAELLGSLPKEKEGHNGSPFIQNKRKHGVAVTGERVTLGHLCLYLSCLFPLEDRILWCKLYQVYPRIKYLEMALLDPRGQAPKRRPHFLLTLH